MYSVLLHDRRLDGNTPELPATTSFAVDETESIDRVLSWVAACHQAYGQMEDLSILCHGYVAKPIGHGIEFGGHGLQFSATGVYQSNIRSWSRIKKMTKRITVYACNVAQVDPFASANQGDGRELCRQLARVTEASVLAPVRSQEYHPEAITFQNGWPGRVQIDFGQWEGPLFLFTPDGRMQNVTPWAGTS